VAERAPEATICLDTFHLIGWATKLDQRKVIRQLRAKGMALEDITREMGSTLPTVNRILARRGKRERRMAAWDPGPGRLSLKEREEIGIGLRKRRSYTSIAKAIGRSPSTVSREVKANGGRGRYYETFRFFEDLDLTVALGMVSSLGVGARDGAVDHSGSAHSWTPMGLSATGVTLSPSLRTRQYATPMHRTPIGTATSPPTAPAVR